MTPLKTLLILGAGALAFGFAQPAQDERQTEIGSTFGAASDAPFSRLRPATIVIRYNPSRIYLTDMLVGALLRPVGAQAANAPSRSLYLLPAADVHRQPEGVYVAQVFLDGSAPADVAAREKLLNNGLAALSDALNERITVPSHRSTVDSLSKLRKSVSDAAEELQIIALEQAALAARGEAKMEANAVLQECQMLEVELAAITSDRERSMGDLKVRQEELAATEAEATRMESDVQRLKLLLKSGVSSNAEVSRAQSDLAAARAHLSNAKNKVLIGTVDLEDMQLRRAQLSDRLVTTQQLLADLQARAKGASPAGVEEAARKAQLDLGQRVLQSKVERLQETISAGESGLMGLTPVFVERW